MAKAIDMSSSFTFLPLPSEARIFLRVLSAPDVYTIRSMGAFVNRFFIFLLFFYIVPLKELHKCFFLGKKIKEIFIDFRKKLAIFRGVGGYYKRACGREADTETTDNPERNMQALFASSIILELFLNNTVKKCDYCGKEIQGKSFFSYIGIKPKAEFDPFDSMSNKSVPTPFEFCSYECYQSNKQQARSN